MLVPQGKDFLIAHGANIQIVEAEDQREAVLRRQRLEHRLGCGIGIDRALEVFGDRIVLHRICAVPAAVGLGGVDMTLAVLGHPPRLGQAGDIVDIDLAPHALGAARGVALEVAALVKALADAVDPAPAQADMDRLHRRDRRQAGADLVEFDPDLGFAVVMAAQPRLERSGIRELVDFAGIDGDRCHQAAAGSRSRTSRPPKSSLSSSATLPS